MSKVEVNEIDKQSGSTLTIGGSGTTVSPDSPSVRVVPHCGATVFTSILDND